MSGTLTGNYPSGYTLSANPITIAGGADVSNAAFGSAVYGPAGPTWTLTNRGTIAETYLLAGDSYGVSFSQAGTLSTVINYGSIAGGNQGQLTPVTGAGAGVVLAAGGSVTNQSGGAISGYQGIELANTLAAVVNAGTIAGVAGAGKYTGVYLAAGGSVTNQTGGTIGGYFGIYEVVGSPATVVNAGVILGAIAVGSKGVYLAGGGSVTNQTGGTISGYANGVSLNDAAYNGTVLNAGTIASTGTAGTALEFSGGLTGTNRLILDPGAVFIGKVSATGVSTLELASGASSGTLSGPGVEYTGFTSIVVDSGAAWSVVSGGVATGYSIYDAGTLTNATTIDSEITLGAGAGLTNARGGLITTVSIAVYGSGASTVANYGTIECNTTAAAGGTGVYLKAGGSVTNMAGGTIGGYAAGLKASGAAAAVVNLGTIASIHGDGVDLAAGGVVTNGQASGTVSSAYINGYNFGIDSTSMNASTITNFGTIGGRPGGMAIQIVTGTVTNEQSATIAGGGNGIQIGAIGTLGDSGTVVNYGSVTGGGSRYGGPNLYYGIKLLGAGSIANLGTNSTIDAYVGVYAAIDDTVTSGGTIESNAGAVGIALAFGGGTNRLIVDPGAAFFGTVSGGGAVTAPVYYGAGNQSLVTIGTVNGTGATTMELATGTGSISGFGTSIVNFASLVFDPGADWTVGGNDAAAGLGTLGIAGFAVGDTIDLSGFVAVSETWAANELTLTNAGNLTATLQVQGSFATTGDFHIASDNAGGTNFFLCFAEGTHIATPSRARRVETLEIGETVCAHFAGSASIEWIGRRHIDCIRHPEPRQVWPVRVAAGAFGAGLPRRTLFLSPNHAVYVNDVLIPVRLLLNGWSIFQAPVDRVTYYHIELARHDLLLSEGLPTESYLDTGDRSNFSNGGETMRLFPNFADRPPNIASFWELNGCAPLIIHGPELEAARSWVDGLAEGAAIVLAEAA